MGSSFSWLMFEYQQNEMIFIEKKVFLSTVIHLTKIKKDVEC